VLSIALLFILEYEEALRQVPLDLLNILNNRRQPAHLLLFVLWLVLIDWRRRHFLLLGVLLDYLRLWLSSLLPGPI
jgi:hypothetical protein